MEIVRFVPRFLGGGTYVKRRIAFIVIALVGVVAVVMGMRAGDPETIHRFAAQI